MNSETSAERKSRLRWRCRRGMRELDLLFDGFLADGYDALDADGRAQFERLLAIEDDILFGWFYQGEMPDDCELRGLVGRISAGFQRAT